MKTIMQLTLARIEMLYGKKDDIHWEMFKNDCIEKEKEQIMKAYKDHHDLGHIFGLDTEQYYNQTYNQNK
jgi:hypothetical protein